MRKEEEKKAKEEADRIKKEEERKAKEEAMEAERKRKEAEEEEKRRKAAEKAEEEMEKQKTTAKCLSTEGCLNKLKSGMINKDKELEKLMNERLIHVDDSLPLSKKLSSLNKTYNMFVLPNE